VKSVCQCKFRDISCFLLIINICIISQQWVSVYIAGYSPLHLCALNGRVEEMKYLIMKGAEVNLKVREKRAEPKNHVKTVSELVKSSSHHLHLYPF
jgi:hypothetical protein